MKNFAKLAFCLLTFSSQVSYGMKEEKDSWTSKILSNEYLDGRDRKSLVQVNKQFQQEIDKKGYYKLNTKKVLENDNLDTFLSLFKDKIKTLILSAGAEKGQEALDKFKKFTFPQLTELNLMSNQISEITEEHLKRFPKIEILNLTHNDIGTDSFKLNNFKCETLRSLILINNVQLSRYGKRSIYDNNIQKKPRLIQTLKKSFPYITKLTIAHSLTGNKLIKDIVNSKISDHLEVLSVFGNEISDIDPLLDASFLHLEKLDLGSNDLYGSGIYSLAECKFPKLKELSLCETKISGKGLMLLSQAEGWGKLKKLHLGWTDIGANDVEDFLNTGFAKSIKFLDLRATKVSEEEKENIRKKFHLKEVK